MSLRPRDLAAAVVALAVAAVFARLGFWQVTRLHERQVRNGIIAARRALPPVDLPLPHLQADALRDRRALARGRYDYAQERVWPGRTFDGAPGVALLTPLRLSDGSAVFVDRGWVASPDARRVDVARYREAARDSVTVTGLVLPAPRDRGDVNPQALRDSLPYAVLPIVIQLEDMATRPPGLRRWPAPALDNGPHLSYAIQWFSFALIVVVGVVVLLAKQSRRENGVR